MRKFQIWWLKLCCFLTGYNYYILSNCSEVSVRKVKKYAAALLIIMTVWAFVGYCFCGRYMKLEVTGSIIGAFISVVIVIQIERQILLSEKNNKWLKFTRIGLALLMAVIGSLIIDQIIFKDDIDKAKMEANQKKVNSLMPEKTRQVTDQISRIDSILKSKEIERNILLQDISRNPNIRTISTSSSPIPLSNTTVDSTKTSITKTTLKYATSTHVNFIPNPKIGQLPSIDSQIANLNAEKTLKENMLLTVKSDLEKEVNSKVGFLDELEVMFSLLTKSSIALLVYIIWLAFLLLLELLILIGKSNESDSDYDKTIEKQMNIHLKKIGLL